ncbi:MAG: PfkB family carbohydrate kinase [Acidobacteriota bacterium]
MTLLVAGSVAFDTVETPYGKREDILGGSATYFALSARFFTKPRIVAVVGTDFDEKYLNLFKKNGIDIQGLEIKEGKTFRWSGVYSDDLNRRTTLRTDLNVFEKFSPELKDELAKSTTIFLANIQPDLQLKILEQMKNPKIIALDTMNHWITGQKDFLIEAIEQSNIFFVNDEEAFLLSGERNAAKACKKIMNWGPEIIIYKKGEHGSIIFYKDKVFAIPGFPVEDAKDPTGAGDSFAGGLLGFIDMQGELNWEIIKKGAVWGTIIASFTVEDFGPEKLLNIDKNNLKDRLNQFRKMTYF